MLRSRRALRERRSKAVVGAPRTGAVVTGGLDDARLLAGYEADEFIARSPREFTSAQALAAIEHLGRINRCLLLGR